MRKKPKILFIVISMLIPFLKRINTHLPSKLRIQFVSLYKKLFPNAINVLFMPTVLCNYDCVYCLIKRFCPLSLEKNVSAKEWICALEKLPPSAITITGGEPLLYQELQQLIEHFPRKHLLSSVVTNLGVGVDMICSLKNKEFRLMASFHPSMVTKEQFKESLLKLKKSGFSNVTINFVAYPQYLSEIPYLKKYFESQTGYFFRIDTFKDPKIEYTKEERQCVRDYKQRGIIAKDRTEGYEFNDFSKKVCNGGKSFFILAPNGNVYSCMEGLFYSEFEPYKGKNNKEDNFFIGNIFNENFTILKRQKVCHSPCAEICDIELAVPKKSKEKNESLNC